MKIYWIGHSLMEAKVQTAHGDVSLFSLLQKFTASRNLPYAMGDHTLYGAPLSMHWSGSVHSYDRKAPEQLQKREIFQKEASSYDAMVLIEGIPVINSIKYEHSPYYLRQFYCTLMMANPKARVFLYEGWVHLYGSDKHGKYPAPSLFNWRERMLADRQVWNDLAARAVNENITAPGLWNSFAALFSFSKDTCTSRSPIAIIPVGTAFVALYDQMQKPASPDVFRLPSGESLNFGDLFNNPYLNWPSDWPLPPGSKADKDEGAKMKLLKTRDPAKDFDDIHPSDIGIYFTALVHFATLYQQSPVGLPPLERLGETVSKTLQTIAWDVVRTDPMTGIQNP